MRMNHYMHVRPREFFWRFTAVWFSKNLGQNLTGVEISGSSERISPGPIRSEVGCPEVSHSPPGRQTSERIGPGEILSELPEISTPVRFWPKFLENHTAVNLQKNSRGQTPWDQVEIKSNKLKGVTLILWCGLMPFGQKYCLAKSVAFLEILHISL